jgi:hypothetical protein
VNITCTSNVPNMEGEWVEAASTRRLTAGW